MPETQPMPSILGLCENALAQVTTARMTASRLSMTLSGPRPEAESPDKDPRCDLRSQLERLNLSLASLNSDLESCLLRLEGIPTELAGGRIFRDNENRAVAGYRTLDS